MSIEILDFELEAHAFRLLRSGRFDRATQVLAAMQEDFAEVPEERIRRCLVRLGERLANNHY